MEISAMDNFEKMAYDRARRKTKEIQGFFINLCCYCGVMPLLAYFNLTVSPGFQWFWFAVAGWGAGLLFHGMEAFNWYPFLGKGWEVRKMKQLIAGMEKRDGQHTAANGDEKEVSAQHFEQAHKRIDCLKGFYVHLAAYFTVNISLLIFWLSESFMPETFWPVTFFVTVAVAGFAVLAHAIAVFGAKYILPKGWEEKKLKQLMDKEKQQKKYE